jgi:4-amino-4-deoxy-L-arabinose transferase-like glycosyltransferase
VTDAPVPKTPARPIESSGPAETPSESIGGGEPPPPAEPAASPAVREEPAASPAAREEPAASPAVREEPAASPAAREEPAASPAVREELAASPAVSPASVAGGAAVACGDAPAREPDPRRLRPSGPRRAPRWRRHALGGVLGVAYLALLLGTAQDIGFARDEGFYFTAADRYQQWFDLLLKDHHQAMKKEVVNSHWDMNAEHPPLMKVLFGLSHRLFCQKLGWLAPSTSYRLPGMLCGAVLIYLLFVFVAKRFGELEAFLASAFLALMPGFFYHAHLDAFDVPITLMAFLTLYAFEKSRASGWWALLTGVFFGLALLTKLNAFFLPPTLFVVWVLRDVMRPTAATLFAAAALILGLLLRLDVRVVGLFAVLLLVAVVWASDRGGGRIGLPRIPLAFFWMLLLGPLMLWAGWPWMWHDTLEHFRGYVNFHAKHDYYNIAYFGVNYFRPPFPVSYPFGMTALTTPVATLFGALVGMGLFLRFRARAMQLDLAQRAALLGPSPTGLRNRLHALLLLPWRAARPGPLPDDDLARAQERSPGIGMFLAVNLLVPVLIIAHPKVFIFGGTKHWMPAWPFLAIFAAIGTAWGLRRLVGVLPDRLAFPAVGGRRLALRPILLGLGALLCLAPAGQGTAQSHPFGLSHYNLLAGGVPGSADLGMCRQFWGFTTGSLLPWLNANVPRNGAVFFHDTAWDSYRMFQTDGTLRKDIRWGASPESSVVSLVHHELHMAELEHAIWQAYGTAAPVYVLTHEGVSIISVYARPGVQLGYHPAPPPAPRPPPPAAARP